MYILVLENEIEIKDKYLSYLKLNNIVFRLEDNYNDEDIEVLIVRSKIIVDIDLINKYKNLKYIARVWVWLDNIDLDLCKSKNIIVINTPDANSDSVADFTLIWILTLTRKLYIKEKTLDNRFSFMWNDLKNQTIWIVWFWNIWKKVYERLLWFWVKDFIIYDPYISENDIKKFNYCKKEEDKLVVFNKSDIISFHLPLLDSTKYFLDIEWFSVLKNNVKIINTSRWGIIKESELIKFLQKNNESSYFGDVWEWEPWEINSDLLNLDNTVLTPHIWAMTNEAEEKMHFFKELI